MNIHNRINKNVMRDIKLYKYNFKIIELHKDNHIMYQEDY